MKRQVALISRQGKYWHANLDGVDYELVSTALRAIAVYRGVRRFLPEATIWIDDSLLTNHWLKRLCNISRIYFNLGHGEEEFKALDYVLGIPPRSCGVCRRSTSAHLDPRQRSFVCVSCGGVQVLPTEWIKNPERLINELRQQTQGEITPGP